MDGLQNLPQAQIGRQQSCKGEHQQMNHQHLWYQQCPHGKPQLIHGNSVFRQQNWRIFRKSSPFMVKLDIFHSPNICVHI